MNSNNLIGIRELRRLSASLERLLEVNIGLKIVLALVFGSLLGVLFSPTLGIVTPDLSRAVVGWLVFPGKLFIALVQMVVIPLVFVSVVSGIAGSGSISQLKKLGVRIGLYFLATTSVAVIVGVGVGYILAPGLSMPRDKLLALSGNQEPGLASSFDSESEQLKGTHSIPAKSPEGSKAISQRIAQGIIAAPSQVASLLPQNPLEAMVSGQMLQIILFAGVVGAALLSMTAAQSLPLLQLSSSLQEVCMTVVRWAMSLAPYAVFGLATQMVSQVGPEILKAMLYYVMTVLCGLSIMMVIYGLMLWFLGRKNPLTFFREIRDVMVLAFSTSSSAAVMPLTMQTAQEKLNVRPQVAQFLIPLGATINMDGTALYQGIATIFLTQAYGIDLSLSDISLVVATAVGASIGSPGTPGVAMVILSSLLISLGVPTSGVALLLAVDRILDMCRTVVNVSGDLVASSIMNRWIQ